MAAAGKQSGGLSTGPSHTPVKARASRARAPVLLVAAAVLCQGCTTAALKRRTVELSESSANLRYREMMENLAMLRNNPWALPSFSSIYAGTTDLSDTATVNLPLVPYVSAAALKTLFQGTLDVSASRAVRENWTLDPVVVPEKLRAMRCACWCVLDGCLRRDAGHSVYLCRYDLAQANPPSPPNPPEMRAPGYHFDVEQHLLASLRGRWLWDGDPGCQRVAFKACCNGRQVYVTEEGMEGLSELTIAIQEIARTDFTTVYYPRPVSRSVKIAGVIAQTDGKKQASPGWLAPPFHINSITVTVDEHGWVTPAANEYSMLNPNQPKARLDNVGVDATLRSAISNAKSP